MYIPQSIIFLYFDLFENTSKSNTNWCLGKKPAAEIREEDKGLLWKKLGHTPQKSKKFQVNKIYNSNSTYGKTLMAHGTRVFCLTQEPKPP